MSANIVWNILKFQLKYRITKVSTYILFSVFFLLGFFSIVSGSLGRGPLVKFLGAEGSVNVNAPFVLYWLYTGMTLFCILVTSTYFGNAAYRDFKENVYKVLFSYPVKKYQYLAGRFTAAFLVTVFVFSGLAFGAFFGSMSPHADATRIGVLNVGVYLQPFLIGVLPNVLFLGAIFFSIALLTRRIFPVYVCGVGFLMISLLSMRLLRVFEGTWGATLLDPFGGMAGKYIYDTWSIAEKNTRLLPLQGHLLVNRGFWLVLGIIVLAATYKAFNLLYARTSSFNFPPLAYLTNIAENIKRKIKGKKGTGKIKQASTPNAGSQLETIKSNSLIKGTGKIKQATAQDVGPQHKALEQNPPALGFQGAPNPTRVAGPFGGVQGQRPLPPEAPACASSSYAQVFFSMRMEFVMMLKNIYFQVFLGMAVVFTLVSGYNSVGLFRGSRTFPVTAKVLETT
ncbi:MAG: ABC transporter permease, partial [bacterium]|nr:ABC transporter permease [bacterium]